MATVEAQIYYPKHTLATSIWENVASVTGTIIIVQTIIHPRSEVFTTSQARINPEHYVIKCVATDMHCITHNGILTLAVCFS